MNSTMIDLAHAHGAAEMAGDLAGTLATLDPEPVFHLLPIGLELRGMDNVRRYYEHFLGNVTPRLDLAKMTMLGEWVGPTGLAQEYVIHYTYPDGRERAFVIEGIIMFGKDRLAGERIYACDELLRIMFEPVWDVLTPIAF